MSDPFDELGLSPTATADEVRAARRRLAKEHHPDTGGDAQQMRAVNEAAAAALRLISADEVAGPDPATPPSTAPERHESSWGGGVRDVPSFTVEALPVETFEALLASVPSVGEVIDDDPPYRLEVLMAAPDACFCRLELVPDAGASTVSLTVAAVDGGTRPSTDRVRDVWIDQLNRLDW